MNKELLEAIMNLCKALDEVAYLAEFAGYRNLRAAADQLHAAAEKSLEKSSHDIPANEQVAIGLLKSY